jgi:hypothetical protein
MALGILALLLPFVVFGAFASPATVLPLRGAPAIVWLEGLLGRVLPVNLLRNCYLADPSQRRVSVVCLD